MTPENKAGNITNFCGAIGNVSKELIAAGVPADALAAGLRIEASKVEAKGTRADMPADELEMVDVQRRGHEFINALQVAGIDERLAISALSNALIERVVRTNGAGGASTWLRNLAGMVDQHGALIEFTSRQH